MPLNYYLDGTTYQIDLYDSDPGFENTLNIRLDSGTKYASLSSDLSHPDATNLRVRINDITYAVLSSSGLYSVWAWGSNSVGQLSQGDIVDRSSPTQIGSYINWYGMCAGGGVTTTLKNDGTLWTCGYNNHGQLAQGDAFVDRSSPVQIGSDTNWSSVFSVNTYLTSAIKTDGTLWVWGYNNNGQLGVGDTNDRSSPVQVGALTDWYEVSTSTFNCSAIKTNGTLWTWGDNTVGQLGQGDFNIHRSSPVQVGTLTTWSKTSTGTYNIFAIKTDGTLWAWGDNTHGELGLGDIVDRSSPTQIGSDTDWSDISISSDSILALKTDGTLWAWGNNSYGELGQGDFNIHRSSPVQIGADTDWRQISAESFHSLAIKTDGTLWAWGLNANGQLGQGDIINRSSPVQIGSDTTWIKVSSSKALKMVV